MLFKKSVLFASLLCLVSMTTTAATVLSATANPHPAMSATQAPAPVTTPATPGTLAPAANISNATRPIQVSRMAPYFTVTLPANSSTGYIWLVKSYDSRLLMLTRHTIQASKSVRVGSPVNETWSFSVNPSGFLAPQMTMIQFVYARPWNLSDNPSVMDFNVVTQ